MARRPEKREVVWDVLRRARRPIAAEEVVRRVRRADASVGRATVYRALRALVRSGALERYPKGYGVPDRATDHHHVVCVDCGRSTVPALANVDRALEEALTRAGFRMVAHDIRVEVRCAGHRP